MPNSMNEKESRKNNVSKLVLLVGLASYWVTTFSFVLSTYLSYDFPNALFVFGIFSLVFTIIVVSGFEAIPKIFVD
ncbi:MAG: hypothetical protein D3914_00740 [Candidatus Electrothrix sp. LOE2]|nr:hypothetical protein [Candidatus Electrothrix sp. LOE2]